MILVGDIGGTRTRLAAFETEGNRLQCVVQKAYPSEEHSGLSEILPLFIRSEGIAVHSACFGVAGPVRKGTSKISNLPWTIDSRDLARQLKLPTVGLLNDLEAYAYGIDALESKDFVSLSEGSEDAEGNRAVISRGQGLAWPGFIGMAFDIIPLLAKADTPTSLRAMTCRLSCWLIFRKSSDASAASGCYPGREFDTSTNFCATRTKQKNRTGCAISSKPRTICRL